MTERIFGALGTSVQASRFIALATHPDLRKESDRIAAAEESLDDTVAVDDPRVAQVAAERHAFETALHAVIESSGLARDDDARFDALDELHPASVDDGAAGSACGSTSLADTVRIMPYDFSPARLRCMELDGTGTIRVTDALPGDGAVDVGEGTGRSVGRDRGHRDR